MDGMTGTPWLGGPMHLHSSRTYECSFNETSKCEYQQGYWRFWYEADHRYAVPTTVLFTVGIIIFSLGYLIDLFFPRTVLRTGLPRKATATIRFLSYRAFRIGAINWNSAPLGVLALGAAGAIFFFCMTLVPRPYYWPNNPNGDWGNSPPIATRAGWLSLGCMPFVFATAGKSNFITALTGVSHEKLQVFHRWISYAFFTTALIHTFPFIVYNIQTGTMREQWNTSVFYWTGVIALIAQAWLTLASISPLRNMSYEWFKFSHFVAALIFILFLFFHCDYTLSAWDYFIATGVLFSLSWLHRQIRIYFEHGVSHRAAVSLTPNGFVCVRVSTTARWQPGQHFFLRFFTLGIHAWSIHPFTACSLPQMTTESELVFYIRPQGGFTARLARLAEAYPQTSIRLLLDGPYGGFDLRKLEQSKRLLVVAGGSGAGWLLPMILAFVQMRDCGKDDERTTASRFMKVVLATRDAHTRSWFEEAVRDILAKPDGTRSLPGLQIEVFCTGSEENEASRKANGQFLQKLDHPEEAQDTKPTPRVSAAADSDSPSTSSTALGIQYSQRRPNLPALVREETAATPLDEQLGVFVCGPLSMQSDVQNAVAAEQLDILKAGSKNVYLHMEHFSWA